MGRRECNGRDCPFCYANRRGRSDYLGHYGHWWRRERKKESRNMVIRRRDDKPGTGVSSPAPGPDSFAEAYPGIVEFLRADRYPDGSPRQTGTMTLFWDQGGPKACLNDRDQGLTAWASGAGMAAALDALERGLQGDCLEWRRPFGGKGKKR